MVTSELPQPEFDWNYLCNVDNIEKIRTNISNRKGVGDIDRVVSSFKCGMKYQLFVRVCTRVLYEIEYAFFECECIYACCHVDLKC